MPYNSLGLWFCQIFGLCHIRKKMTVELKKKGNAHLLLNRITFN